MAAFPPVLAAGDESGALSVWDLDPMRWQASGGAVLRYPRLAEHEAAVTAVAIDAEVVGACSRVLLTASELEVESATAVVGDLRCDLITTLEF